MPCPCQKVTSRAVVAVAGLVARGAEYLPKIIVADIRDREGMTGRDHRPPRS